MVPRLYALVKLIQLYFIVCKLYLNKSDIYKASCAAKCPLWAGLLTWVRPEGEERETEAQECGAPREWWWGIGQQKPRCARGEGLQPWAVNRRPGRSSHAASPFRFLSPVGTTELPTLRQRNEWPVYPKSDCDPGGRSP